MIEFFNDLQVNTAMAFYGSIASIVLGVVLLSVGFYLKKKKKEWWILVVLLGAASVCVNALQLM
ncbi:LPXTG cell wall anchor domain-containing protein [Listeria innocua]|uniref:LPXTG cell wall anchor domain-containing protein n=1 Tax=Listeria TaxID=1637 RepID=UPI0011EAD56B|nr:MULTISPECIES: LPXTG cell wall anchor domain-containing protein [Listeria]EBF5116957.1 LPXTG cell wall anchor domain-containing protein [Listeria monocytogenes]EBF5125877.1 LPXTG cell wall anchor domain-containing protein [Listeria monocytogenes]EBF5152417.1 LPXTG cell wall anchor domain-containing protein [Listeria monocytogenes]MBC1339520.1 LPXTG cell wall anchor domain-containing protein [Listeria innocua]MBC1353743.1 LPXTG cell wall anchor domain-containing protein [Listeria innocua]